MIKLYNPVKLKMNMKSNTHNDMQLKDTVKLLIFGWHFFFGVESCKSFHFQE